MHWPPSAVGPCYTPNGVQSPRDCLPTRPSTTTSSSEHVENREPPTMPKSQAAKELAAKQKAQ
ncbi:MAG: hypothetical protein DI600_06240, partial [Cutibacterium granulosum]